MKRLTALFLALLFLPHGAIGAKEPIVDSFAENNLKGIVSKNTVKPPIVDEFALKTLENHKSVYVFRTAIKDEFVEATLSPSEYKIVKNKKSEISESFWQNPVFVSSVEDITTQSEIYEGKKISFIVLKDVVKNDKIVVPKGSQITGRVELITQNGPFGSPAYLTVGNFVLQNGKNIEGEIKISGANRSLWVYPVGYVGTIFFGVGALAFTIRGGHAKIKQRHEFELNYVHD